MESAAVAGCSGPCIAPSLAVGACALMAVLYVVLLYAPSVLLCLPPPASLRDHMLRRFAGAAIATGLSLFLAHRLLSSIESDSVAVNTGWWLNALGLQGYHWVQAIIFPLLLTSLLYLGPLAMAASEMYEDWREGHISSTGTGGSCPRHSTWGSLYSLKLLISDVLAWRNFVMAPLTEELVFRACMIPILLCAGLRVTTIIFLCPLFFGLAHANHFWELVHSQNYDKKRALLIVGGQLGYTTVFGWYASFLYLRTGSIMAPFAAHVFCNIMGFPDLHGVFQQGGLIFIFCAGVIAFFVMLVPASHPCLYHDVSGICYCWLGYCKWK